MNKNGLGERMIENIEECDFLTGGLNRQGFLTQARIKINEWDSCDGLAIMLFNINGFKAINELFGISGGDELLKVVYRYFLKSSLHPLLVARMEGDSFACLVEQKQIDYAKLPALCEGSFTKNKKTIHIDVRCGIYLIEDYRLSVTRMCDYAKLAMRNIEDGFAKSYKVFDGDMRTQYLMQAELQGKVLSALERKEFEVYYQPVFEARTGELVMAEALVRWNYPDKRLLFPNEFVSILEKNGHISKVDYFVYHEVKRFVEERLLKQQRVVPVSINLSWRDFYNEEMMQIISHKINKNSMDNPYTLFELTESSYTALLECADESMDHLRKAGVQLILDDFGSGQSSLGMVQEHTFSIVKLDVGLVQRLGTGAHVKSIVHSLIDMFHHMGTKVVAVGVEKKEQMDFLVRHECDYIQGNYCARAMKQEAFAQLLDEKKVQDVSYIEKKHFDFTDLVNVDMLQQMQNSFAKMSNMAALTVAADGKQITASSNTTAFCKQLMLSSEDSRKRCASCNQKWVEKAFEEGKCCTYECHAGLMNFIVPLGAGNENLAYFIGGQYLQDEIDYEKYRTIAKKMCIDEDVFFSLLKQVPRINQENVEHAMDFLYSTANIVSDIAYSKHLLDVSNGMLQDKNLELDYLANYDKLTHLSNRHHMQSFLEEYEKSGKEYCVVISDVDSFKKVNDTYGHACGDEVLATISKITLEELGDKCVPCRWGGEEFLYLMYGEKERVVAIVDSLRKVIENTSTLYGEYEVGVTVTFGVAESHEDASIQRLISIADQRLYYGKQHGKNQVVSESAGDE